jgi:hypothetical protein|tara:strand:- start:1214 stop:2473 length:1260 start_codon:yes stop_codon:yes gene_type:complete
MATNYGFSGLNNSLTNGNDNNAILSSLEAINGKVISGRVTDIVISDTSPKFENYGQWNGIGTVEFENVNEPNPNGTISVASPLFPHLTNYPIINEILLIFSLPDKTQSGRLNESFKYYYISPTSCWNHPHHNAVPTPLLTEATMEPVNDTDYIQMESGVPRTTQNSEFELNLNPPTGGTFVEKDNIHPLLPFMGDVIMEGRFGNSIRLGNTAKSDSILYKNNWSNSGENGNPITIIRNGQPSDTSSEGFEPIIENINKDLSSIYLTSNQVIPINSEFTDFPALNTNPSSLNEYSANQILLSSGRLVLNSSTDSIFLTSNQSVSLNAVKDIGLFSRKSNVILQGKEVRLGEKNASESIILGDKFMVGFEQLLFGISLLCDSLSSEPLLGPSSATAANLKVMAENMKSQTKTYLSKSVKSI